MSISLLFFIFFSLAIVGEAADVQPCLPEVTSQCGERGWLHDDRSLALSLLQRGAKRLLNMEQSHMREASASLNKAATVDVSNLSLHVIVNRSAKSIAEKPLQPEDAGSAPQRTLQFFENRRCHGCKKETEVILGITCTLILVIVLIFTAFCFFREDREEQVTPLCPQMVVREPSLTFKLSLDRLTDKIDIVNADDPSKILAKLAMDWPDPFRPCASGIASTARLMNTASMNMATVVARNCAVSGQALALCRHQCEIFGFVEPDTTMRYHVKHRTGVHLLTLVGDFANMNVDGVNPAGAVVSQARKEGGHIIGKVQQHVDAGLMICCVISATVHRVLQKPESASNPFGFGGDDPLAEGSDIRKDSETPQEKVDTQNEIPPFTGDDGKDSPSNVEADSMLEAQSSGLVEASQTDVHDY